MPALTEPSSELLSSQLPGASSIHPIKEQLQLLCAARDNLLLQLLRTNHTTIGRLGWKEPYNPPPPPSAIPYLHVCTSDEPLRVPALLLDDLLDSLHHSCCPRWLFARIPAELPPPAGPHAPTLGAHALLSHGSQWGPAEGNPLNDSEGSRVGLAIGKGALLSACMQPGARWGWHCAPTRPQRGVVGVMPAPGSSRSSSASLNVPPPAFTALSHLL